MSLDFNAIFEKIEFQKPKSTINETHLYADYVELKVLFLNGDHFTSTDLLDLVRDEKWSFYNQEDLNYFKSFNDSGEIGSNASLKDDVKEGTANRIFDLLKFRRDLFKQYYPFELVKNRLSLKDVITEEQKIYIFLLIACKLEDFKDFKTDLTTDFEKLSKLVLEKYLPLETQIFEIGKNSELTATITREKIKELSQKIPIEIDTTSIIKNIHHRNNQEDGVDIIAWIPFEDSIANKLIFLCQCTCGKDWIKKMNDMNSYHNYLKFYHIKPIDIMLTSYSLMDQDNKFFQDVNFKTSGILLFERKRILEYIKDASIFASYNSYHIVNNCISYFDKKLV